MRLLIAMDGAEPAGSAGLNSLARWIDAERITGLELRDEAQTAASETMGLASEALQILAPGGAGAAIAVSVSAWLDTRRSSTKIVVKRGDRTLKIEAGDSDVIAQTLKQFLK